MTDPSSNGTQLRRSVVLLIAMTVLLSLSAVQGLARSQTEDLIVGCSHSPACSES